MVNIITVWDTQDLDMIAEKHRFDQNVPPGWIYKKYTDGNDQVQKIASAGGRLSLDTLEFDCHGSPTTFNSLDISSVFQFGQNLSQVPGFSANTVIYLDGCNSGLTFKGGPIAQKLASAAGCTVFAPRGFLFGTFAENTARCEATSGGYGPYPGAANASGPAVWLEFHPLPLRELEFIMSLTIHVAKEPDGEAVGIAAIIDATLATDPVKFPLLRMSRDVTVSYEHDNEAVTLDVYANGTLIRNAETGTSWRVPKEKVEQFLRLLRDNLELE